MGKALLVDRTIDAGRKLLEELDRRNLNVCAALWYYDPESDTWQLIIASSRVEEEGPKAVYTTIQDTLKKLPDLDISLLDVSAVSHKDTLIKLVGSAVHLEGTGGVEFVGNTINGVFIEKAFIYRSQCEHA